jgi:hypothetical protein
MTVRTIADSQKLPLRHLLSLTRPYGPSVMVHKVWNTYVYDFLENLEIFSKTVEIDVILESS